MLNRGQGANGGLDPWAQRCAGGEQGRPAPSVAVNIRVKLRAHRADATDVYNYLVRCGPFEIAGEGQRQIAIRLSVAAEGRSGAF